MLSFYQILQVKETATDAEVKQAYRKLCKVLHPDLNDNTAEANTIFGLLQQSYETLSDPLKRKAYDKKPIRTNGDDTLVESYKMQNELQGKVLKDYEKKIKDYKETVYLKNKRERELINEIDELKERNLQTERIAFEEDKFEKKDQIIQEEANPQNQQGTNWTRIMLIIIAVNLGMFLSYLAIGNAFWFFF